MLDGSLMSNIKYELYVESIFKPIIDLAKFGGSSSLLKTCGLSKETITAQNKYIKSFKISQSGPIEIHNSNFIVRFESSGNLYLSVSVDSVSDAEKGFLIDGLIRDGLEIVEFEIGFFMSFCYSLNHIYTIKAGLDENGLTDALGLGVRETEEGYTGHTFEELIEIFKEVVVFKIPANSIYVDKSDWYVVAKFAANYSGFRSSAISSSIVDIAVKLLEIDHLNPENLYLSLTSSHWKHSFLEIYRCLEAIYYLPWMLELKKESQSPHNAFKLAAICNKTVLWHEKEKESIMALFALLPPAEISHLNLRNVKPLTGLAAPTDPKKMKLLGERIYGIRNQCVHQEDYEPISKLTITNNCWPVLTQLLYHASYYFYNTYKIDIVNT